MARITSLLINTLALKWANPSEPLGVLSSPRSSGIRQSMIIENVEGLTPGDWENNFSKAVSGRSALLSRKYENIKLSITVRVNQNQYSTPQEIRDTFYKLISPGNQSNFYGRDTVYLIATDENGFDYTMYATIAGIDTSLFEKTSRFTVRLDGLSYYWDKFVLDGTYPYTTSTPAATTSANLAYEGYGHLATPFNLEFTNYAGGGTKYIYITTEPLSSFGAKASWICIAAPVGFAPGDKFYMHQYNPRKEFYMYSGTTFTNLLPYMTLTDREGRWPKVSPGQGTLRLIVTTSPTIDFDNPPTTSNSRGIDKFASSPQYLGF